MIAYLRRKAYEETDARFSGFSDILPVLYDEIEFKNGSAWVDGVDLSGVDAMYFRAVGGCYECVNELIGIARTNNIPIIDRYLLVHGAVPRTKRYMHDTLENWRVGSLGAPEIRQPAYAIAPSLSTIADVAQEHSIEYPYVAKISKGGRQGLGTFFVNHQDDIDKIQQELRRRREEEEGSSYDMGRREWIVQEYIPNNGDYRAIVVGNKCIGITKRGRKKGGLVMNKSMRGSRRFKNGRWPKDIGRMAVRSARQLDVDIAGVDIVRHEETNEPYVIEVNEAPRFHSFERVTKINVALNIVEYIRSIASEGTQD